jgi:hypothetical protein
MEQRAVLAVMACIMSPRRRIGNRYGGGRATPIYPGLETGQNDAMGMLCQNVDEKSLRK